MDVLRPYSMYVASLACCSARARARLIYHPRPRPSARPVSPGTIQLSGWRAQNFSTVSTHKRLWLWLWLEQLTMATPSAETYQSMTVEALRDCLAAAKAELEARASIMYEPDEHAQMVQDLIVLDRLRRVKAACERH